MILSSKFLLTQHVMQCFSLKVICMIIVIFTKISKLHKNNHTFSLSPQRYNVGCTKRIGLFRNPEESPYKRMREDDSMEEPDHAPQLEVAEPQDTGSEMEVDDGTMAVEGTPLPSSKVEEEDESANTESPTKSPRVDILRWTVRISFFPVIPFVVALGE